MKNKEYLHVIIIIIVMIVIYHIMTNIIFTNKQDSTIIYFGIPGGPKHPKKKGLDSEKKITGFAYIYDEGLNDYKLFRDDNGEKMILDDINFSDDNILNLINKYRIRAGQNQISKDELIGLAKSLGYKTNNKNGSKMLYNKEETSQTYMSELGIDTDFMNLHNGLDF